MQPILKIINKVLNNERISKEEGLVLLKEAPLPTLGALANRIRKSFHPDNIVTFVVDRNINYTNVCVSQCKFCAFYRNHKSGYILSFEEIGKKIDELNQETETLIDEIEKWQT